MIRSSWKRDLNQTVDLKSFEDSCKNHWNTSTERIATLSWSDKQNAPSNLMSEDLVPILNSLYKQIDIVIALLISDKLDIESLRDIKIHSDTV